MQTLSATVESRFKIGYVGEYGRFENSMDRKSAPEHRNIFKNNIFPRFSNKFFLFFADFQDQAANIKAVSVCLDVLTFVIAALVSIFESESG